MVIGTLELSNVNKCTILSCSTVTILFIKIPIYLIICVPFIKVKEFIQQKLNSDSQWISPN